MNRRSEITKEMAIDAEAMMPMAVFDRRFPKMPLIAAPIRGTIGMSQRMSNVCIVKACDPHPALRATLFHREREWPQHVRLVLREGGEKRRVRVAVSLPFE